MMMRLAAVRSEPDDISTRVSSLEGAIHSIAEKMAKLIQMQEETGEKIERGRGIVG